MRIFVGLIMIVLGIAMVIKTEAMMSLTGKIDWAEIHMRLSGGTRPFLKLVGIGIIIVGIIVMLNLIENIFGPLLRTIFRA